MRAATAHRHRPLSRFRSAVLVPACLALSALAVVSCGSLGKDKEGKTARHTGGRQVVALTEGAGASALEERFAYSKEDIQRSEDGTITGGKRSRFENRRFVAFGGGVGKAGYPKPTYETPTWSGTRSISPQTYRGVPDASRFQTASRYDGATAAAAGRTARASGATSRAMSSSGTSMRATGK